MRGRSTVVPRPRRRSLAGQLGEGAANGDQAAAVPLRELALRREEIAGTPFARVERRTKVQVDLVVKRDGTELESEAGHREGGTSRDDPGRAVATSSLLRDLAMLITL
jgi:hypothetical protein